MQAHIPYFKYISRFLSFIPHPTIQWFCGAEDQLSGYGTKALADLIREVQDCKDGNPRPSLFSTLLDDIDNPSAKYRLNMTDLRNELTVFIIVRTDTVTITGT